MLFRLGAGDRGGEQLAAERYHRFVPPDLNWVPETATGSGVAARRFGFAPELFTSW
jgi:hypothetical protein